VIQLPPHALLTEWIETARAIYRDRLNRLPDADGLAAWLARFAGGTTGEQMDAEVVAGGEYAALHPPFRPLPRLRVRRQAFELETGDRFTAVQCSDFALLARYQHEGPDAVEPILRQRRDLSFNLLRVWTRYQGWSIGGDSFTDIDYARVGAFLDACARHGLYVELVGYAGTRLAPTDTSTTWPDDPAHWPQLVAAVSGKTNVLLELGNELDQPANQLAHLAEYQRPAGILASHGSNGSQAWPVEPYWDYATFHTNGSSEEQRKVGHNALEIWSGPTLTNEISRFPDVGMWVGADATRVAALAFDSAAGAALLNAGACFHSVQGKTSVLFTGATFDAARSFVAGARSVDLVCQDGPYTHRIDREGANDLRVYERPVDGHNCLVPIRK
jgi:hypothetical protein